MGRPFGSLSANLGREIFDGVFEGGMGVSALE